jgi:hypothetical protein
MSADWQFFKRQKPMIFREKNRHSHKEISQNFESDKPLTLRIAYISKIFAISFLFQTVG